MSYVVVLKLFSVNFFPVLGCVMSVLGMKVKLEMSFFSQE